MSDVMFYGILNMPYELAMCDEVSRFQFYKTAQKAADRIVELEKEKENYKYDPDTGEPLIDGYPLYSGLPTPQTKPLAYEEIAEIWKKLWQGGNIGHIAYTYARAIEERHGIK